jgi:glycosyltransferase involved in cell wall biosynthesis
MMKVSVIIPTYNREGVLCETIDQVLNQKYPDFELIVVDQTSVHEQATNDYLEVHRSQIRYFQLSKPSLPAARNFGVKQANGEIILFIDDDVLIQDDFILKHIKNFEDPDIVGVSGQVIEATNPVTTYEQKIGEVTIWGRFNGNRSSMVRKNIKWASGGNASFRKQDILETNGFDEAFEGNAIFEDVDFSFRIRKNGGVIVFDPEATLTHLAVKTGGCNTRASDQTNYYYWFIRNKTLFFMKNFPRYTIPFLIVTNFARALKTGIIDNKNVQDFLYLLSAIRDGINSWKISKN